MNRYLLDTNHLSSFLDRRQKLVAKVEAGLQAGDRFGLCSQQYNLALLSSDQDFQAVASLRVENWL